MTVGDSRVPEKMRSGRGPHEVGGSLGGDKWEAERWPSQARPCFLCPGPHPCPEWAGQNLGRGANHIGCR